MKEIHDIQATELAEWILAEKPKKECQAEFMDKYKFKSVKTFDVRWKLAKQKAHEITKQRNEVLKQKHREDAERDADLLVLSANQKRHILAKIATDETTKPADMIRAITELNKMDGDLSAQRVENTIKADFEDWTDEELEKELKRLTNG